jgi:hypothetical protein
MKRLVLFTFLIVSSGCTTLRPIDGSASELRQRIESGELLKAGDRVSIMTTDDKRHRFAIKSIGAGIIRGRSDSVPIEQVVTVQQRQFSRAKTAGLIIGIAIAGSFIGLGVYAASHLSVGF